MFPTLVFRRAFDQLQSARPSMAVREYLRLLHLAASTSEVEVGQAIECMLASNELATFDACRARMPSLKQPVPQLSSAPVIDLSTYDRLLAGGAHG
jgi:hypothetical protein